MSATEQLREMLEPKTRVLWDGDSTTGAGGTSNKFDLNGFSRLTILGNAGGSTTLTLEGSHNGSDWFTMNEVTSSASGDFFINLDVGIEHIRLASDNDVTVEAYAQAKF